MSSLELIRPSFSGTSGGELTFPGRDLPRGTYLLQIPGILALVGMVALVMDSERGMALAAVTATATAFYLLWDWLFRQGPTRIFHILTINLLLGYGMGTSISYMTLPHAGDFASHWGATQHVLAQGMASVLLVSALLCFLGELAERPLLLSNIRVSCTPKNCLFVYGFSLSLVAAYLTHSLGFGGMDSSPNIQQNPIVAILITGTTPMVGVGLSMAISAPKRSTRWILIACTLVPALILTTIDRRAVFYMIIQTLFLLRTCGYRLQGNFLRNAMLMGLLGAFAFLGINFFMLLRISAYGDAKAGAHIPMADRLDTVGGWIADGSALERAMTANRGNISSRSFVLHFYADIEEGCLHRPPGMGVNLITSFVASIPRVLYPDKTSGYFMGVRLQSEEALADQLFGLTYTDGANSILSQGAVDYGLFGMVLFPVLLAYLMQKAIHFMYRFLNDFSCILVAAIGVTLLLPTEQALFIYFAAFRNLILFAVILYCFERIPLPAFRVGVHEA